MSIIKAAVGAIGEALLKGVAATSETLTMDLQKDKQASKGTIDRINDSKRQAAEMAKTNSISDRLQALKAERTSQSLSRGDKHKAKDKGFER